MLRRCLELPSPSRRLSSGRTNAAVWPLPVWAITRRSFALQRGAESLPPAPASGSTKLSSATALSRAFMQGRIGKHGGTTSKKSTKRCIA